MFDFLRVDSVDLEVVTVLVVLLSVVGVALVPWMVTCIPVDYFAREESPPVPWHSAHPLLRILIRVARNVFGVTLLLAGILMLVLPGQGLLTIFLGALLVEHPGKRKAELRLVSFGRVRRGLNWIRTRAGSEPLVFLDSADDDRTTSGAQSKGEHHES